MIDYGMTKTAQLAIARGVAESVAGTGVTVNAVLPGPTKSEILSNWMKGMAKPRASRKRGRAGVPEDDAADDADQRFATTEEVANMVVYVCSEQARHDRRRLRVDGGVLEADRLGLRPAPHAVRRIAPPAASAIERAPNRMKMTPTSRVTATPWARKNRRTAGSRR